MAEVIAFGKSTICLFKKQQVFNILQSLLFFKLFMVLKYLQDKGPRSPRQGERSTAAKTNPEWNSSPMRSEKKCHSLHCVTAVGVQSCLFAHPNPLLWTHPSLDRRRGTSLKSMQKFWKIVTCLTSCLCKDFTVKGAEGPNRSEHVEVLLCWPKRFREAKPGLLRNFFLYAVNY